MRLELEGKRALVSGSTAGIGRAIAAGLAAEGAEVHHGTTKTARPTSLLQRFATPEEVAALAVFVAGGPASAVNGAALRVDGGVVRAIV